VGDHQGVYDAWEGARRAGKETLSEHDAMLAHLAAVAVCRLGREGEARRLWQEALKQMPGLDLARANLDDLRQPPGQRHGPWPFSLASWIPASTVEELSRRLGGPARSRNDKAVTEATRRFLETHPELTALTPLLLDRGDPDGRGLARRLARMAETPEMLAALHAFALGQRGPDQHRIEAGEAAQAAGLMPSGPVRFWANGE
jgi:hypothetical protein